MDYSRLPEGLPAPEDDGAADHLPGTPIPPLALAAEPLKLPTFETAGMTLFRRLTPVAEGGRVVKAFYPVFPPDRDAEAVLAWLSQSGDGGAEN